METPVKMQLRQLWLQVFINACMTLYALSMLLNAFYTHVAWRILISATASVFFPYVLVNTILKITKLRRAEREEL
ncbi:hypothetical protein [Mucilaginibacter sp. dw_454]|uniref:hypothetical protein n=1 Tax=Mucilaginibacter sp. dw_454 TaxID=2720079 RepID=UPI001BD6D84D|nr:hypothetical protein [Mucilaginibacter sp. dw_454]